MLLSKISIILASSIYTLVNSIMRSVWQRGQPVAGPGLQAGAVEQQSRLSAELYDLLPPTTYEWNKLCYELGRARSYMICSRQQLMNEPSCDAVSVERGALEFTPANNWWMKLVVKADEWTIKYYSLWNILECLGYAKDLWIEYSKLIRIRLYALNIIY